MVTAIVLISAARDAGGPAAVVRRSGRSQKKRGAFRRLSVSESA
jgi:hypothetical protein